MGLVNSSSVNEYYKDNKIGKVKYIWFTLDDFMYSRVIDEGWGYIMYDIKVEDVESMLKEVIGDAEKSGYSDKDIVIRKCEMENGEVYDNKNIDEMRNKFIGI